MNMLRDEGIDWDEYENLFVGGGVMKLIEGAQSILELVE